MEGNLTCNIDICKAIPVGKTKCLFIFNKIRNPFQTTPGLRFLTRIDQCYTPRFSLSLMHLHLIVLHVERDIGHMQKVVGKVFLDHITLVSAANHKIMDTMSRIRLHDVPQDGFATDLDHRFWLEKGFFRNTGAKATGKNHSFHLVSFETLNP